MKVVQFKPHHMLDLNTMLLSQGSFVTKEVPKYGYIAFDGGIAIAACFLRRVEGGYGQIDGLVALKSIDRCIKQQAIDIVIDKCISKAKSLGIKNVLAFCERKRPIMTALSHGFVKLPHTILALDTKG